MSQEEGTLVLTGCRTGLGAAIASHFLSSPEAASIRALFGVRDPSAAVELCKSVDEAAKSGQRHEVVAIDLSTLASVRKAAKNINDRVKAGKLPPIRALILNAGVQKTAGQTFTDDGLEEHFAVNYLANYLFTLLLLPSLDRQHGRIVFVSSWTHDPSHIFNTFIREESHKTIIKDDLNELAKPKHADKKGDEFDAGWRRYGVSKTLMVTFMYELQRRLLADPKLSKISVTAVDPGALTGTTLFRTAPLFYRVLLGYILVALLPLFTWWNPNGYFREIPKSAADLYSAAFDDEQNDDTRPRPLYLDGTVPHETSPESRDQAKQKRVWDFSVQLSGIKQSETPVRLN